MSDIKDIIPEKDWRKVKIQDYPATPTPQNVPSEYFLNGMSDAIKGAVFIFEFHSPASTEWTDVVKIEVPENMIPVKAILNDPNKTWEDFNKSNVWYLSEDMKYAHFKLNNSGQAGRKIKFIFLKYY